MAHLLGFNHFYFRGGAYGFKLDILAKLIELKANDSKKTLMFYLIETISENNEEELFEISKILDRLSDSKCISLSSEHARY